MTEEQIRMLKDIKNVLTPSAREVIEALEAESTQHQQQNKQLIADLESVYYYLSREQYISAESVADYALQQIQGNGEER